MQSEHTYSVIEPVTRRADEDRPVVRMIQRRRTVITSTAEESLHCFILALRPYGVEAGRYVGEKEEDVDE